MYDDFESSDDDFDWMSDPDEDSSSDEELGITDDLSWVQGGDDEPVNDEDPDDADLDWLDEGMAASQPSSGSARTGVTGELSWLQGDAEAPDAEGAGDDLDIGWLSDGGLESASETGTGITDELDWAQGDAVFSEDTPSTEETPARSGLTDILDEMAERRQTGSLSDPEEGSPDWLSNLSPRQGDEEPDVEESTESPDWLAGMGDAFGEVAEEQEPVSEEPDWMEDADGLFDTGEPVDSETAATPDMPGWLSKDTGELASEDDDQLDWMSDMDGDAPEQDAEPAELDWMEDADGLFDTSQPAASEAAATPDMPDWLTKDTGELVSQDEEEIAQPRTEAADEKLDWLLDSSDVFDSSQPPADDEVPAEEVEIPHWLSKDTGELTDPEPVAAEADDALDVLFDEPLEDNLEPLAEATGGLFDDLPDDTGNFFDYDDEQGEDVLRYTDDEAAVVDDFFDEVVVDGEDGDVIDTDYLIKLGLKPGLEDDDGSVVEDEQEDWFAEEAVNESSPDWLDTLGEVDLDDLIPEESDPVLDADLDSLLDELEVAGDGDVYGGDLDSLLDELDIEDDIAAPAADLDSLLATFDEDVEFDEGDEEVALSETDYDTLFDSALSGVDEIDALDELPRTDVPDWLQDVSVSDDESSAAAIIRQQTDRPIEELPDRLQQLRERGLSLGASEGEMAEADGLPGISEELISTPDTDLVRQVQLTPQQQDGVQLLQELVGIDLLAPALAGDEDDEDALPALEDLADGRPGISVRPQAGTRRRIGARRRVSAGRILIGIILTVLVFAPFFVSDLRIGGLPVAAFESDHSASPVFAHVDAVQPGQLVLVAFEYGPTAAGELDTASDVLLRHIIARGAHPVIVSGNPIGLLRGENMMTDLATAASLRMNLDYNILRLIPGGVIGLRDFGQNVTIATRQDAHGHATGLNIASLDDFALIVVVAERIEELRGWAEQVAPLTRTPLVAATGYSTMPLAIPYVSEASNIRGLMVSYQDAYTYNQMLMDQYGALAGTSSEDEQPQVTEVEPTAIPPTIEPTEIPPTTDEIQATEIPPIDIPVTATPIATDVPPTTIPTEVSDTATPLPPTATNTPAPPTATNTPEPVIVEVAVVAAGGSVNVRSGPGSSGFAVVGIANPGDEFLIIGFNDDESWVNIEFGDGEAWVAAFLVEIEERLETEIGALPGGLTTLQIISMNRSMGMGLGGIKIAQANTPEATEIAATPTLSDDPEMTAEPQPTDVPRSQPRLVDASVTNDEKRWYAINLGIAGSVIIILVGNLYYGLRGFIAWLRSR